MTGCVGMKCVVWRLVDVVLVAIICFYNPHNDRALKCNAFSHLIIAPCVRLPTGHPVGWNFEAHALLERELDSDISIGSGMHDPVIG